MENEKYVFIELKSKYKIDPIFKCSKFSFFSNPEINGSPELFHVYIKDKCYMYCLVNPNSLGEEFCKKIKAYLVVHEDGVTVDQIPNCYFFGEMEKSIDVSSEFTNQNINLVTYEMVDQWYPRTLNSKFKILINHLMKHQKYLGQHQLFFSIDEDYLFIDKELTDLEKRDYKIYLLQSLERQGFISRISNGMVLDCFVLTEKAVSDYEDEDNVNNKNVFIAMKFDNNEKRINAIQDAIAIAGFSPIIMNRVETNNWIMPEIFYQIKICKFVVVDFSLPCDGAYYEAGYAAALEKPVIHLFDKREASETNKLHFDIAQKSTIFYEDFGDLKTRLINRIKATIK